MPGATVGCLGQWEHSAATLGQSVQMLGAVHSAMHTTHGPAADKGRGWLKLRSILNWRAAADTASAFFEGQEDQSAGCEASWSLDTLDL